VALIQSLAATLAERYEAEGTLPIQPRTLVEENKWRAARYGLDAQLIDFSRDEARQAREAALELVELALPCARKLGCEAQLDEIERLCARGSGADEQRRVEKEEGTLLAVAKWLAEQTVTGV
jgi:glutamate---cysteine ligase / carboxylate-amine ligase